MHLYFQEQQKKLLKPNKNKTVHVKTIETKTCCKDLYLKYISTLKYGLLKTNQIRQ